jgi:lipopolysaccharide export system permease protein
MTTLDRYLAKQMLASLARTLSALILIFILVNLLTDRRAAVVEHAIPWRVVAEFYLCSIPTILYEYQIAALAMLISSLLVLGSAAQHNEVTAMLAGGISLRRIVCVPVAIALLLAIGVFAMEETIGIPATRRAEALEDRYFAHNTQGGRGGVSWVNLPGGWKVHVRKYNRLAHTGEGILMQTFEGEHEEEITANRIYWEPDSGEWIIEDGTHSIYGLDEAGGAEHSAIRQETAPMIPYGPEVLFDAEEPSAGKTLRALATTIETARERGIPTTGLEVDWHGKLGKPALCFIMVWLAIPFAMRLRRGGLAIGLGVSIATGLAYLSVFAAAQTLGYIGKISPITAAWFANLVFLVFGLGMYIRAPR